jgi:hypothetical protein
MLAVGFNPVQSQSVKESRKTLHDTQNREGQNEPHCKHDHREDNAKHARATERALEGHVVQYFGKLRVCKGKGPETQVGRTAEGRAIKDSVSRLPA